MDELDLSYNPITSNPAVKGVSDVAGLLPSIQTRPQRFLLLSDIHGNWPALVAVLEDAAGRYDAIWFLGDLLGYGPYPIECLDFARRHIAPSRWRFGNHDVTLLDGASYARAEDAQVTLERHRQAIRESRPHLWSWLRRRATPQNGGPVVRRYGRGQQVFTHANLDNDFDIYLYPAATFRTRPALLQLRKFLPNPAATGWLLAGHTHIPCLFYLGAHETDQLGAKPRSIYWGEPTPVDQGHFYINPGSVGQPRDGNPDASYAILDTRALTVTWHRARYPIRTTVNELRRLAYPPTLAERLLAGGTARTIEEIQPYYRQAPEGLIAFADSEHR